jgi:hypothetical protein
MGKMNVRAIEIANKAADQFVASDGVVNTRQIQEAVEAEMGNYPDKQWVERHLDIRFNRVWVARI